MTMQMPAQSLVERYARRGDVVCLALDNSRTADVEVWSPVPGFATYDASTFGRVRCWGKPGSGSGRGRRDEPRIVKSRPLKPKGYLQVDLREGGRRQTFYVHRLVLLVFVGPCPDGMEARHFPDRDPANCRLNNLSCGTGVDNAADREVHGTVVRGDRHFSRARPEMVLRGDQVGNAKLTRKEVDGLRAKYAAGGVSQRALASEHGISQGHVSDLVNMKRWAHMARAGGLP